MIEAASIWFNADESAWWVVPDALGIPFYKDGDVFTGVRGLDRPCDHCEEWFHNGDGTVQSLGKRDPACNGTARHTFPLTLHLPGLKVLGTPGGRVQLRVSIRPGKVCRIIDEQQLMHGTDPVVLIDPWGQPHLLDGENPDLITLPAAANPGMWAVLLDILDYRQAVT